MSNLLCSTLILIRSIWRRSLFIATFSRTILTFFYRWHNRPSCSFSLFGHRVDSHRHRGRSFIRRFAVIRIIEAFFFQVFSGKSFIFSGCLSKNRYYFLFQRCQRRYFRDAAPVFFFFFFISALFLEDFFFVAEHQSSLLSTRDTSSLAVICLSLLCVSHL